MEATALHQAPPLRDVAIEQVRAAGLSLRGAILAAVGVAGVVTLLLMLDVTSDGRAVDFLPHQWVLSGVLGVLLPLVLWRGEKPFGAAFLWTLPVDRRSHSLTKVFAGWVWLMAVVAAFVLLLLAATLVSGGNIMAEQTLRFLPPHLNPVLAGRVDPAAVETVRWTPNPVLWLVPFSGATVTYLLASATLLGATFRSMFRVAVGLILLVIAVATLGEVLDSRWLIFAPSRMTEAVLSEPYGLATVLTATPEFIPVDAVMPNGETVMIGSGAPDPARWAMATLLWLGVGLVALWLAASRHRE